MLPPRARLRLLRQPAHRPGRDRPAPRGHPAQRRHGPTAGVIFHADRGCLYTSAKLADAAGVLGVRQSVGRTGVCWDNAQQESFWSTLKTRYYNRRTFTTRARAITAVSR